MNTLLVIIVVAALVLLSPVLLIWSVNTLASGSSFQIAYGFWEILAALVLIGLVNAKQ